MHAYVLALQSRSCTFSVYALGSYEPLQLLWLLQMGKHPVLWEKVAVLWPAYRLSLRSGWRHTLLALLVEAGNVTTYTAATMHSCEHNGHRPTCAERLCVGIGMSKFIHHGMIYVVRGIYMACHIMCNYRLFYIRQCTEEPFCTCNINVFRG